MAWGHWTWMIAVGLGVVGGCGRTPIDLFDDLDGGRPPSDSRPDGTPDGGDGGDTDVPDAPPDAPPDAGACTSDVECDDGLVCTGRERCIDALCQPGEAVACDDCQACTRDRCVE